MKTYQEINLDEDPIIVPQCGHIVLMSSLDGTVDMTSVYEMNEDGTVKAIKSTEPFSSLELKDLAGCPTCRGSLRSINRYGRLVRRVLLDESTKRFVTWAGSQFTPLAEQLYKAQEGLADTVAHPSMYKVPQAVSIIGKRASQFRFIHNHTRTWGRYKSLNEVYSEIFKYFNKVNKDETPFAKLSQLVKVAQLRSGQANATELRSPVSQVSFHVMVLALLIRCEVALIADVLDQFRRATQHSPGTKFQVDLAENRDECNRLICDALDVKDYERAVEGHIFFARYCAIEIKFTNAAELITTLEAEGRDHIKKANILCNEHGGRLKTLVSEIKGAERALGGGTFMQLVSSEERRAVLRAMANEFRGTGHWYVCENRHPFSIGECGMPMELARCPQCGATIGGQNHMTTQGTVRAEELELELRDMQLNR